MRENAPDYVVILEIQLMYSFKTLEYMFLNLCWVLSLCQYLNQFLIWYEIEPREEHSLLL